MAHQLAILVSLSKFIIYEEDNAIRPMLMDVQLIEDFLKFLENFKKLLEGSKRFRKLFVRESFSLSDKY